MAQLTVLIVDSNPPGKIGSQLHTILRDEGGYRVEFFGGSLSESVERSESDPALIILVLPASRERADLVVAEVEAKAVFIPLLVVASEETVPERSELSPPTADFLVTPICRAEVLMRIRRLISQRRRKDRETVENSLTDEASLSNLVGENPAFAALKLKIHRIAKCDLPVLITGETGTGKELCARALHYLSDRAAKPFLPVNCGAIPFDLFESVMFGREKGAFTGASSAQPGFVAEAEGGTLFLDEIETLNLPAQAKLLRFLEDHTYHVLGSPRPRRSDVRILAATNVSLIDKAQSGTFREDLYHRLAVLALTLPPLRDRPGDIPLLVALFLARYATKHGGEGKQLSPGAMEALGRYAWPGNVRELENVIHEVIVLTQTRIIEAADLRIRLPTVKKERGSGSMKQAKAKVLEQFEKSYLTDLLQAHHGNVTQAANEAQKERRAFGRLVKKHRLPKH